MSDLQIALMAIGALIIIAVIVINWWQERRFHHQVESSFSPLKKDALLDDPSLDASDLYDASDSRASDHFSIDSELPEIAMQSQSIESPIKYQSADRYVKLPESHDVDETYSNHEVLQEAVSIDTAYDQLVNTKLERLYAVDTEAKSNLNVNSDTNTDIHSIPSNSFKEVFDEALNPDSLTEDKHQAAQQNLLEPTVSLPAMLHGQMDLTALLYLAAETSINTLSKALTALFDSFDKPVFVHVLDTNNSWHLLEDVASGPEVLTRQISRVACSMQLADRGGAVSRNTLNRFHLAVETFGLDINGHVEWQGAGDALTNANALDAFCIEVDKTIGFHLVHGENGAFTGTKLRGLAEAQGMTLGSAASFKYFSDTANKPSFVMFNRDDYPFSPEMLRTSVVKGVTFQLDIPHVKQCAEAFGQMVQVARQMEIGLNAVLVDDNNKVLGDMQIEKIRQQLKVIQATMLVRGIVPGSDSALRLFS